MRYWLEVRATCQHCLGNARCYACGGVGCCVEDDTYTVECEECGGSGICTACEGGKETWLFFTVGEGKRGSRLTRAEIAAWRADGTLPEWWAGHHGMPETSKQATT